MAKQRNIVIHAFGDAVRVVSIEKPRFCVEAATRDEALRLATEAFAYFDSVSDVHFEHVPARHDDAKLEQLCA